MTLFTPTRAAGLARLQEFLPNTGSRYENERNADYGPANRSNISLLSPYVRHRLITEDEIIREVLTRFAFSTAEKFIQEVCWRTYWKGWLELRPSIWSDYTARVAELVATLGEGAGANRPLRKRWLTAVDGNTGIACFDDWTRELIETGYLHNHARMWFASIWIFTLNLPWQLGADFFYRHLLDGDPASNTLSWRWVAGLQTRGKHYLARADNIQKYTQNRYWPKGTLNEAAEALPPDDLPAPRLLPVLTKPDLSLRTALWLTEEDLHAESLPLAGLDGSVVAIGGAVSTEARSPLPVAEPVLAYTRAALDDGLARASAKWNLPAQVVSPSERYRWCLDHEIKQVLTAYAPIGPAADSWREFERELAGWGIRLLTVRRDWDSAFWPFATKGFFQLRERIRPALRDLGIP